MVIGPCAIACYIRPRYIEGLYYCYLNGGGGGGVGWGGGVGGGGGGGGGVGGVGGGGVVGGGGGGVGGGGAKKAVWATCSFFAILGLDGKWHIRYVDKMFF